MKTRVLIIDDDDAILQSCQTILEDEGFEVELASAAHAGLALLRKNSFDLALVDLRLPGTTGLKVLQEAKKIAPELTVIIFTAYGTIESAVEAVKLGAFNYISKPFTASQLMAVLNNALRHRGPLRPAPALSQQLKDTDASSRIVGSSQVIQSCLALVAKVASSDADVLVLGESGTGKELVARALHANSSRRNGPFIPIDCAAMPSHLLESELFGYEKGAFTGADQLKRGLLEIANGGTVFFDEIGEMNAELQAKLLRTLQERAFRRLGSERLTNVDVRVVSSTNRNLQNEAQQGRFRPDLLYRLNVVTITLPPLRERQGDISLLVEHFLRVFGAAVNKPDVQIEPEALQLLQAYHWPGNVRELRNVVERAVVLCDGNVGAADLPETVRNQQTGNVTPPFTSYKAAREQWLEDNGKQYLLSLLEQHQGNISAAAREAQISRKSFYELLRRFAIPVR
ncbi:MAG: sigma-54-dependent transcriptional regulator [Terriglobales bacterium]